MIQFRVVERDLANLIDLNDYETLRLIEVLGDLEHISVARSLGSSSTSHSNSQTLFQGPC